MSRYNNKTYRIDDIDWDKNPQSTFSTRSGEVSFIQYYENAYNKKITDLEQPLLVSMPKKRVSLCVRLARFAETLAKTLKNSNSDVSTTCHQ